MADSATTPREIEVIRVSGSHREAGRQIGAATAESVAHRAERIGPRVVQAAEPFRQATLDTWPWIVDELDGVAEGADAHPLAVFASSVEEIADLYGDAGASEGRCSDLVACPAASADGHLWVAHTNDLPPELEDELIAIERRVDGEPAIFTVGIGPWLSVGFNDAGLSLTGNELTPNDNQVGIPRLLQVREILRRRTLDSAVEAALHPRRASSYNNVLAHRDGGVVSVEGSATDAEVIQPSADGTLAHTNHYVSERMRRYEGDVPYAARSDVRYRAALRWLASGAITAKHLRSALSDHEGAPDSICRHPEDGAQSKTIFWCIADVTEGKLMYGRGNPCNSTEQTHAYA